MLLFITKLAQLQIRAHGPLCAQHLRHPGRVQPGPETFTHSARSVGVWPMRRATGPISASRPSGRDGRAWILEEQNGGTHPHR
jgi:hypothetical protein